MEQIRIKVLTQKSETVAGMVGGNSHFVPCLVIGVGTVRQTARPRFQEVEQNSSLTKKMYDTTTVSAAGI